MYLQQKRSTQQSNNYYEIPTKRHAPAQRPVDQILQMQRMYGNQAVLRMLQHQHHSVIQRMTSEKVWTKINTLLDESQSPFSNLSLTDAMVDQLVELTDEFVTEEQEDAFISKFLKNWEAIHAGEATFIENVANVLSAEGVVDERAKTWATSKRKQRVQDLSPTIDVNADLALGLQQGLQAIPPTRHGEAQNLLNAQDGPAEQFLDKMDIFKDTFEDLVLKSATRPEYELSTGTLADFKRAMQVYLTLILKHMSRDFLAGMFSFDVMGGGARVQFREYVFDEEYDPDIHAGRFLKNYMNPELSGQSSDVRMSESLALSILTTGEAGLSSIENMIPEEPLRFQTALAMVRQNITFVCSHIRRFNLSQEHQIKVGSEAAAVLNLEIGDYVENFDHLHGNAQRMSRLFAIAVRHSNGVATPEALAPSINKFFGAIDFRTIPDLHLFIEPTGFMTGKTTNVTKLKADFKDRNMDSVFNAIKKSSNPLPALRWIGYFMLVAGRPEAVDKTRLARTLVNYLDSKAKYAMTDLITETGTPNLIEGISVRTHNMWQWLLEQLYPGYQSDNNVMNHIAKVAKLVKLNKSAGDAQDQGFIYMLLAIQKARLEAKFKQTIIRKFFMDHVAVESLDTVRENMLQVETMINLGRETELLSTENYTNINTMVMGKFSEVLGFTDDIITFEQMEMLKSKLRDVKDLLTYAATLKTIKDEGERSRAMENFKKFVVSLLSDEGYRDLRYQLSDTDMSNLKDMFSEKLEGLLEWQTGGVLAPQDETDKGWLVSDTDNPSDMFMIGSDVGSCQSIDQDVNYSKCLLSYLLEGKNRAIIIKTNMSSSIDPQAAKKSPIRARAIFRILTDQKTNEPVLFLEKPYFNSMEDEEYAQTKIIAMARARSTAIGSAFGMSGNIPLYVSEDYGVGGTPNTNELRSMSDKVDHEYVDVLGGVEGGVWIIDPGKVNRIN